MTGQVHGLGTDCACGQPRLRYSYACADCDPSYTPPPPPRCQRPLRCYCPATPDCLGHPSNALTRNGPVRPESVAAAYAAARPRLSIVK